MSAFENYRRIAQDVARCAQENGRNPEDVNLIAVSKTVGVPQVEDAVRAGAHHFGENRPELLAEKSEALPDENWHFIGNIQSRRIPQIVQHACLIHSLYQESHADKINAAAAEMGKVQDVLIEVNVSGEESKIAATPEEARALLDHCLALPNVRVRGLMTMAPQGDPQAVEQTFAGLAALADSMREGMAQSDAEVFTELSMGMSEDWQQAIKHGATMVRIGRAIFSDAFVG